MSHQTFRHIQTGILFHPYIGLAHGGIHTADLGGIQCKHRSFFQFNFCHRVQDLLSCSFAFSVVLFFIPDIGVFAHMKSMNSIMACIVTAGIMDSTAGYDGHIRSFFYIKIIVHNIRHSRNCQDNRDMYLFSLSLFADIYIDSLTVRLSLDLDMLAVSMAEGSSIVAQVVRAFLPETLRINLGEYLTGNRVQFFHIPFHQCTLLSFMQTQDG